jgi:hypothetical protein
MSENPIPVLTAAALHREGCPTSVVDRFCSSYPGGMAVARAVVEGISSKFSELDLNILTMLVLNITATCRLHEAREAISRAFCSMRDGLDAMGKANCCILCHNVQLGVIEKFLFNPDNYVFKLLKEKKA